jgi:hypothetical protein
VGKNLHGTIKDTPMQHKDVQRHGLLDQIGIEKFHAASLESYLNNP